MSIYVYAYACTYTCLHGNMHICLYAFFGIGIFSFEDVCKTNIGTYFQTTNTVF